MSSFVLNGARVDLVPGDTILAAARRSGVDVPTLCHMEGVTPPGGCRVCLVEVEGASRPLAACHTPAVAEAVVTTDSPLLRRLRQGVLSLYARDGGAPVAEEGTELHRLLASMEVELPLLPRGGQGTPLDQSHPYLRIRPELCITCSRCVLACEQWQGQFVYAMAERGPGVRLIWGSSETFADSPCVACGACVDACPTGAIVDRDRIGREAAEAETDTVCGYCGVGCRLRVETAAGRVLRVRGVPDAQVNWGHLCVKGRYAHAWHRSPDRLTRPLVRNDAGELVETSWEEALAFTARRLAGIRDAHGPTALGTMTSSRSTNESAYLLQKLFRAVLGTNNVDCCARVCHSSTALALQLVTGTGAASASYQDIEGARCIVVAGANPTEAHPVVGARIKQAVLAGARLIVIDPRRIELAEYADVHLALHPGTNVPLFNALAKLLVEEGGANLPYLDDRVEGLEEFRRFLGRADLDALVEICRVSEKDVRAAARLLAQGPVLFVHGLGLSELTTGTHSVMTLCNLGMLTGSIGRPGAGMLPLRGQNNVQGNADMGGMPGQVTGYQRLDDPEVRARLEEEWGAVPPEKGGLTIPEMLEGAAEGTVRGLWIQGEDVLQSDPNETRVREALENLDLLVVQEMFFSETCRHAHVILPATGFLENEGTFTNGERRIQRVRPAVPGPEGARADWEAVQDVARRLGAGWDYEGPAAIMDEIARVAPGLFGGVSYERLGPDGLQWPCPTPDHPGTAVVHADGFIRGRGLLVAVDHRPSPEHDVADFPYTLVTGRVLDHYNVGTMTRRTPQAELECADFLEVHPVDAEVLGIGSGDTVTLESRWGGATAPARVTDRVAPGTVFLSFHFPETHANCLTGPHHDPQSKCPEYKVTAVRIGAAGRPTSVEDGASGGTSRGRRGNPTTDPPNDTPPLEGAP